MPTYPITQPADNAAAYTYTQPIRDTIAGVNDHQTRITTLEAGGGGGSVVSPMSYGAAGTGVNDATALNAAISALTPGDTLLIDRVYGHSSVITYNKPGTTIIGGGEIRALAEATSAFIITADDVRASNIKFTCPTTTVRGETLQHQKLVLNGCDGTILEKVTVGSSAAAGMFIYGASNYLFYKCHVENSRADAYHNVKGSHDGTFIQCTAYNIGDDGIAVVSYATGGDAGLCHHIRASDCRIEQSNTGRLFSVIGGEDIEYTDCFGKGSFAAGIIVATETFVTTHNVARVTMTSMDIRNANTVGTGRPDHGAVLIDAAVASSTISDVTLRNISVRDTDTAASKQAAITGVGTAVLSNILWENVSYYGVGPTTEFFSNVAASSYRLVDVKALASTGWELLGSYKASGGAVTSGAITVPARDELMIVVGNVGTSGGADILALRFNADAGNNYWSRYITSAAGGVTLVNVETVSTSMARLSGNSTAAPRSHTVMLRNFASWEKLGSVVTATSVGGAAAAGPADIFGAIQWANTTAQITSVELRTVGGVATINSGTTLQIFGRNG